MLKYIIISMVKEFALQILLLVCAIGFLVQRNMLSIHGLFVGSVFMFTTLSAVFYVKRQRDNAIDIPGNMVEITYRYKGNTYFIRQKRPDGIRGPTILFERSDVTYLYGGLLGPFKDFHKNVVSDPQLLIPHPATLCFDDGTIQTLA